MLCEGCSKNKLQKEFPPENVCDERHAQLYCIRCVMAAVKRANQCPACKAHVTEEDQKYIGCVQKLKWLFPPFKVDEGACARASEGALGYSHLALNVEVVMLNGDKANMLVSRAESITDFKQKISTKFGIEARKQRLIYNDKPLETYKSNRLMKVGDYNMTNNSTITLIKVLKTISDSLRQVTFDFSWEYVGMRDYLNASAVLYSGSSRVEYVDFKHQHGAHMYLLSHGFGSVTHSGHGFRGSSRYARFGSRGHHVLKVNLETLPSSIDKIFFTLSALNTGSVQDFKNLLLEFYDSRNPTEQLCNDKISRSVHNKAVVFCCLCRIDGCWQVFSLQEPSQGNVRDYSPLFASIQALILRGFS
ncbi:hypothetical protein QZH41_009426 [Actinostola sp. cb2023]|nr:hypothetical protein QZH41_009426 [Actinostola sp. cb2023]